MVSPTQTPAAIYPNGAPVEKSAVRTWMNEVVTQALMETVTGNVIELQNVGGTCTSFVSTDVGHS